MKNHFLRKNTIFGKKMKNYTHHTESSDSSWVKPTIVFLDNNHKYVCQWLNDCEKHNVQSVNGEEFPEYPPVPLSTASDTFCEEADISTDNETEIQKWSTWRTKVNERLINNVLVLDQLYAEVDSDVRENVPSSVVCYQEASKSMHRSSTDLSLPDFTVYGIPRARLGK
ncbi:uncharacterized protein LOC125669728 isoform X2 [Ostrea edulis]|uniref:uncharacterized protein LOC125669728 isoform X2 n=1 Tax=Ostrea edulis TaxID=37623 RepID=UPI0024AFD963|nr:uncharacterized protein LOC125669728 isoform X2 [Ostrea edulis]